MSDKNIEKKDESNKDANSVFVDEKLAKNNLKEEQEVVKVEKELKEEKIYNNFNGLLSIANLVLLICAVFAIVIYESSFSTKTKTRFIETRSDVNQLQDKVQTLLEGNNISDIKFNNSINQIQNLEEKINFLEKSLSNQQSKIDLSLAKFDKFSTEPKFDRIDLSVGYQKLMLRDIQYLLKLAYRKVYLEKDISNSLNLLKEADNYLSTIDLPIALKIRKSVANEINMLNSLDVPDTEGIVLELIAIQENIYNLPKLGYNFSNNQNIEELSSRDSVKDWKNNLGIGLNDFFKKVIVIKKYDNKENYILTYDQIAVLDDKINILLLETQLAAYSQQQTIFEQNLEKIITLLKKYFDREDSMTDHVINELIEMKNKSVIFVEPTEFDSLKLITDYLSNNM